MIINHFINLCASKYLTNIPENQRIQKETSGMK